MMKRTEKSKANSRQKSKANSRQKSTANVRQSKPKDNDRDKAKYEEEHSTEESYSQPVPKHPKNRCRCPAGATRAEAWRNDRDHPKDRLRRGNRGAQENHPDSSEAETQKVQKIVRIPQVRDREHLDAFSQLEADESAKHAKAAEMSFDEQKTFTATKEDLEQSTTDVLEVMQRQVLVIQKAPRTVDIPLLQYSDTTVDVPVAKQRREDTTGLHDEVERNPDGQQMRSAYLRTENKKQDVFDSESGSDLSFTVQQDTGVIHRKVKGGTKIICHSKENQSEISKTRRLKDLV